MSLDWNVSNVKDSDTVCFEHREASGSQEAGRYLKTVTNSLIWATMAVGIGAITEQNWIDFYARLRLLEKLEGARRFQMVEGTKDCEDRYFEPGEVKAHIGLSTNVSNETFLKWIRRIAESHIRDGVRIAKKSDKADNAEPE